MIKIDEITRLRSVIRIYNSKEKVTLSSGKESDYYIDLRKITLSQVGSCLISDILFYMLEDYKVDAIGGMTLGADPIVSSYALYSYLRERTIRSFIVRKERKTYGMKNWIEGDLRNNDNIVVIDDVTTTGRSLLKTINIIKCEVPTCNIIKVITIVDRLEGAKELLGTNGYKLISLFTKNDL